MFSALKNGVNSASGELDLKSKIMEALEPAITKHWSTIEPYAEQAMNAAQNDETIEKLASQIYPWLPALVRMALKQEKFVQFVLENKTPILAKLTEIKNNQA